MVENGAYDETFLSINYGSRSTMMIYRRKFDRKFQATELFLWPRFLLRCIMFVSLHIKEASQCYQCKGYGVFPNYVLCLVTIA